MRVVAEERHALSGRESLENHLQDGQVMGQANS